MINLIHSKFHMKFHRKPLGNIVLVKLLCCFALASNSFAQGKSEPKSATSAKQELSLVTATLREGKVVASTRQSFCVLPGAFEAHAFIGQMASDSNCKVLQAPSGQGSFFRFSCDNGAISRSGSIRKLTDTSFVTAHVEAGADGSISRGTVGEITGPCTN
jgi:hypothetical protein